MRPLPFIVLYLVLIFASVMFEEHGVVTYLSFCLTLAAFGLQVHWSYRALIYVMATSGSAEIASSVGAMWISLVAGILLLALVVAYTLLLEAHIASSQVRFVLSRLIAPVLGFLGVGMLLRVFWIPAAALCDAEERGKSPVHSIVGIFLLFVYLMLGIPFIFKRLMRLAPDRMP